MNCKNYPKVLVVSHNVFSTTSNMGKTMSALFQGWSKENIAQLYFHTEIPNSDVCTNFFRVTDFEMVDAIFKNKKPGKLLDKSDIKLNTASSRVDTGLKADIYIAGSKRKPYMYFIRNLIWGTNKWKTKEIINWIDSFNPNIVFYAAGDYIFSMKIAIEICKYKNIPLVVFFGDDYYFCNTQKGLINWYNRKVYKDEFAKLFSYLKYFIAASDKMQKKYSEVFNKPGYAIMTSTNIFNVDNSYNDMRISYIGNLGLDRWKSLVEIGRCLKQIGRVLDVYSGEKTQSIISKLNYENGIKFHEGVSSSEVKKIIKSSTIIIHVESMEEINREKTRYSMSTKIAESLGSGVCLFAYGPEDVSSIEYLAENDAACIVTKKEDLHNKLQEIINNEQLRKKYINSALQLAAKRHDFCTNTQLFYKIVTKTCSSKEGSVYENFTSK